MAQHRLIEETFPLRKGLRRFQAGKKSAAQPYQHLAYLVDPAVAGGLPDGDFAALLPDPDNKSKRQALNKNIKAITR